MSEEKTTENQPNTSSAEPASVRVDEETDSSLLELTKGVEKEGEEKGSETAEVRKDAPVPPHTPQSGISILAHKIWIGNLDKRLSQ